MPLPTPPNELLRALAVLSEPPEPGHRPLARALGLGVPPSEAVYTDLFVFQLYPYASVYLGDDGRMGGEARDRIAGFWRALGETPPAEPDHLAVLLALLARLAELEDGARGRVPARRWRHARRVLLWEHLLSWVPAYLGAVAPLAPPYYGRWAALLLRCLRREAGRGAPSSAPQPRNRPWRRTPDPSVPETWIARLLAPGQSGVILARDHLRRAARELGLVARVGERRFVLEQLASRGGPVVLHWLGREARKQAAAHRRCRRWLGEPALRWQLRAESTARQALRMAAPGGPTRRETRKESCPGPDGTST